LINGQELGIRIQESGCRASRARRALVLGGHIGSPLPPPKFRRSTHLEVGMNRRCRPEGLSSFILECGSLLPLSKAAASRRTPNVGPEPVLNGAAASHFFKNHKVALRLPNYLLPGEKVADGGSRMRGHGLLATCARPVPGTLGGGQLSLFLRGSLGLCCLAAQSCRSAPAGAVSSLAAPLLSVRRLQREKTTGEAELHAR
jgi:hypothetical protein